MKTLKIVPRFSFCNVAKKLGERVLLLNEEDEISHEIWIARLNVSRHIS